MKNFSKILVVSGVLFMLTTALRATEVEPQGTMQRKLQRGFLNVALSPLEISNELAKEKNNDALPPSWLTGFGRGAVYMVGRALTGVYEMVTFAVPYPSNYKPIIQPEFPWEHLPDNSPKS